MRILFSLVFLLAAPLASAQSVTLSGTVRDSVGQPLAGVPVQVIANTGVNPRTVIQTHVSDEAGSYAFAFDRTGIHVLRVLLDSTASFNPEVPFLTDRTGDERADLVLAPGTFQGRPSTVARLAFADSGSRASRLAGVFGYGGAQMPLATDDLEPAVLARGLVDALRSGEGIGAEQAQRALEGIAPDSPFWLATGDYYLMLRTIDATGAPEAYASAMEAYVTGQPDPFSVMGFAYEAAGKARASGDEARIARYLDYVRETAPDSYWGSRTLAEFALDRAVRPGEPVPDFAFPRLDGTGTITPEALLGQVYLIDFWAMWCGPCLRERSELQDLYATHQPRGLEIVSVSFDFEREDVDFERWPMPWQHAYFKPDEPETQAVMDTFALGALPKLVLVGADGRVIAGGAELRPETLGNILPNVLR